MSPAAGRRLRRLPLPLRRADAGRGGRRCWRRARDGPRSPRAGARPRRLSRLHHGRGLARLHRRAGACARARGRRRRLGRLQDEGRCRPRGRPSPGRSHPRGDRTRPGPDDGRQPALGRRRGHRLHGPPRRVRARSSSRSPPAPTTSSATPPSRGHRPHPRGHRGARPQPGHLQAVLPGRGAPRLPVRPLPASAASTRCSAILLLAAHFGVPVCPHGGGAGLDELAQHLCAFDYIAVSGDLRDRVLEYVGHLHEHFSRPGHGQPRPLPPPGAPGLQLRAAARGHRHVPLPGGDAHGATVNRPRQSNESRRDPCTNTPTRSRARSRGRAQHLRIDVLEMVCRAAERPPRWPVLGGRDPGRPVLPPPAPRSGAAGLARARPLPALQGSCRPDPLRGRWPAAASSRWRSWRRSGASPPAWRATPTASCPGSRWWPGRSGHGVAVGAGHGLGPVARACPSPRPPAAPSALRRRARVVRPARRRRARRRGRLGGCHVRGQVPPGQPHRHRRLQRHPADRRDRGRHAHRAHRRRSGAPSAGTSRRSTVTTSARSSTPSTAPTRSTPGPRSSSPARRRDGA